MVNHIDRYLKVVSRNENSIYNRIMELVESNLEYVSNVDSLEEDMSKLSAVSEYYDQATDLSNPNRDQFTLTPEMHGNLMSQV